MKAFRNKDAPFVSGADEAGRSALLRRAAEAGPGYRGIRTPLQAEDAQALASELESAGVSPPPYLRTATLWIDRRAKLFEAGEFPDKGVTVTAEDLGRLAAGFTLPVPILIEHAESPLAIGYLTDVEATGNELFGNLALTEEANSLIDRSGARSLSLGLDRDFTRICEVSLVRNPRVPTARLFASDLRFWTDLADSEVDWRVRCRELESRLNRREAERKVASLVAQGRLTPAQSEYAAALFMAGGSIEFDGRSQPIALLAEKLIEKGPTLSLYSELTPTSGEASNSLFLPEEVEFYRRHFPDVSLDLIAARQTGK